MVFLTPNLGPAARRSDATVADTKDRYAALSLHLSHFFTATGYQYSAEPTMAFHASKIVK